MEKATHAKISNNAPFLVSILENARKTHMGIFFVFSITLVPGFSQNTTFVEDKTAANGINEVRRRKVNLLSELSYWPFL